MSIDQTLLNGQETEAAVVKAEDKGEVFGSTEETQREQQLQTAQSPRIVLVQGNVHTQENRDTVQIKQEPWDPFIIQEREQLPCPEDGRKRKRKFDPEELKVLVAGARAHYHELRKQNVTIVRRNAIWEEITNRVNAVGHKNRTPCEIKRRWQDAKRRTKEKLATSNASVSRKRTGPSEHISRDTGEEQVLLSLCEEQVNRIAGIDSLIPEQDLCGNPSSSTSHSQGIQPRRQKSLNKDLEKTLSEMKSQNASIQDGLCLMTDNIRSISKVARALRGDTRAISRHSRELVSAVTGLTAAVQELTKAVSQCCPPKQELERVQEI